jgi:murein DD-endopeptidase MepM/ murein hydrolase activator NlpD
MKEASIPTKFQHLKTRLALALLRGIGTFGRGLMYLGKKVSPFFIRVFSLFSTIFLLPLYKFNLLLRLRIGRLMLSARGFFFLLFTNRYVFHAAIILISVFTVAGQLQAKKAVAMDTSTHSLLYALVTRGQDEIIEETAQPTHLNQGISYLGADTIEAVPHVDFDYELETEEQPIADLTVPGSIAILPGGDIEGVPGEKIIPSRNSIETYVVQPGDTLASIAARFGLNVGTVVWANNLKNTAIIRPGDSLKILPVSGVLHTIKKGETLAKISTSYKINADEIALANRLDGTALAVNQEILIPGGSPIEAPKPKPAPVVVGNPSKKVSVRTDIPVSKISNKSYDVYQEVANNQSDNRPKPEDLPADSSRSRLLWPTKLRRINQYYGWKHTGVDIDGDYVDPIYASEDGVVKEAGWNSGGYGLQIVIDHENGMKTRYAHASKIFVAAGDKVKRGEVIAMVGTTGRSTGTHLHYEVYVNGKRQNPLAYTK